MANKLDGLVRYAIQLMREGNYDLAIGIATRANTPEAQKIWREAVEREAEEAQARKASWAEFVQKSAEIWG